MNSCGASVGRASQNRSKSMNEILIVTLLVVSIFALLGCGVWVGLTLAGTAWIGMEVLSSRPAGDAMAVTIWGASSSWTLTALPLFLWMGEILFRTRLSEDLFKGLAPWLNRLPGRLLHTNVIGCAIFAAVSGSSAATCATVGKMTIPELTRRGYPEDKILGTLSGAGTLGLLIPPSIIMIVYGVAADVSIAKLFIAGIFPGLLLALLFMGYIAWWAIRHPGAVPAADPGISFMQKLKQSRHLIPVLLLIGAVLGSIYTGIATATEAAAVGVVGALILSALQGSLTRTSFMTSLLGATRLYCMIALILAGAQFLPGHGLHRPAPRAGRVDRRAGPVPVRPDHGLDGVLRRAGLLPGRHFHRRPDHGRAAAHRAGRRHRPDLVRHLHRVRG
ncbi:TRAP dicarboxylate transporter subunit DctM [Bordetella pertussis]|uniref:TRAP transporter large permease protein n=2 Tax=Bordetella pertussis TaxID=520 RepID=Q45366_BORPT|nr:hypothetical protein [Bordetella pertussis]CFN63817.1 TRAP dicarboxylate transporter subunit DctM [Bordetella pertussis]CFT86822.1 TRAP dicarboxylate transporter subunit DctM [Bordetella pertussis]CFV95099.1 TRAP dicarboxylate transporter subunit DctM [Bordetella pertussis]CFW42827.1 TRAP dicarboxylate transporter subunit DctM [Bordetella pertussis]